MKIETDRRFTMYKVVKDLKKNFIVDIDGKNVSIGELSDDQLRSLRTAGKYRQRNGERKEGLQMEYLAIVEMLDRGYQLRKV
jgi:hypothetical protein